MDMKDSLSRVGVGVDHGPRSAFGKPLGPGDLRGKQLPGMRVCRLQVLQVDAGAAVTAAHTGLATVGPRHRTRVLADRSGFGEALIG